MAEPIEPTEPPLSTKDALIAVMEELATILDPLPEDQPLPADTRVALAAPLKRARELAAALDGEPGATSAYQLALGAIEQRIAVSGTPT